MITGSGIQPTVINELKEISQDIVHRLKKYDILHIAYLTDSVTDGHLSTPLRERNSSTYSSRERGRGRFPHRLTVGLYDFGGTFIIIFGTSMGGFRFRYNAT